MQIKKGLFVDKYPLCDDILQPFIYKKAPKFLSLKTASRSAPSKKGP